MDNTWLFYKINSNYNLLNIRPSKNTYSDFLIKIVCLLSICYYLNFLTKYWKPYLILKPNLYINFSLLFQRIILIKKS